MCRASSMFQSLKHHRPHTLYIHAEGGLEKLQFEDHIPYWLSWMHVHVVKQLCERLLWRAAVWFTRFHLSRLSRWCRMTELPFVPRERLLKRQQYFQSIQKHTYLKGPYDKVTSVAIPLALAATSVFMIVSSCFPSILGSESCRCAFPFVCACCHLQPCFCDFIFWSFSNEITDSCLCNKMAIQS